MSYTIKKEDNGTYTVRAWAKNKDVFGKRKSKQKTGIRTYAVANQVARKFEDQITENKDYDKMTFKRLNDLYMQNRKEDMSPATIDFLESRGIPRILEYMGNVLIKDINTRVVQGFVDMMSRRANSHDPEKTLKKGTVVRYYRHIQAVLNFGVRFDYLEYNRVLRVKFEDDEEIFEPTILTAEEIGNTLNFFKVNYYNLYIPVLLSVTSSLRRGEILGLKWEDIDFDNNIFYLNKNLIQVNNAIIERNKLKTKKSKRHIALSFLLKRELLEHKEMCKGLNANYVCENVFMSGCPKPSYVTKTFHKIMLNKFGIDMRLHDLRHNFSQLGFENNIDDLTRSTIMGHSNTNTTKIYYTHPSLKKEKEAIDIVASCIEKYIK